MPRFMNAWITLCLDNIRVHWMSRQCISNKNIKEREKTYNPVTFLQKSANQQQNQHWMKTEVTRCKRKIKGCCWCFWQHAKSRLYVYFIKYAINHVNILVSFIYCLTIYIGIQFSQMLSRHWVTRHNVF